MPVAKFKKYQDQPDNKEIQQKKENSPKSTTPPPKDEKASIPAEPTSVNEQIKKIRDGITKVLNTIAAEASLITRAASWFGSKPWWVKLLIGILLITPTLVTGLITHIIAFYVFCGLTALIYIAVSALLTNHCRSIKKYIAPLKDGIFGIADILGSVIEQLDTLSAKISVEVTKLEKENETLSHSVKSLTTQVSTLSTNVNELKATEVKLKSSVSELDKISAKLKADVEKYAEILKDTEEKLKTTKVDYENAAEKLKEEVKGLQILNGSMNKELNKTQSIASNLKATIDLLAGTVIEDEEDRKKFKATLDGFLTNTQTSFAKVTKELDESNRKLADTTKQYVDLLKRQEDQVVRLEKIHVATPPKANSSNSSNDFMFFKDTKIDGKINDIASSNVILDQEKEYTV